MRQPHAARLPYLWLIPNLCVATIHRLTNGCWGRDHFAGTITTKQSIPRCCLGHEIRFFAVVAGSTGFAHDASFRLGYYDRLSFVFFLAMFGRT